MEEVPHFLETLHDEAALKNHDIEDDDLNPEKQKQESIKAEAAANSGKPRASSVLLARNGPHHGQKQPAPFLSAAQARSPTELK